MAFIRGKGSVFQLEVATVLTAIAQLTSIDLPEHEAETFEADAFDNSSPGIPYKSTGRVEGGSIGIEGFLDPALTSFQILTDLLNTPILVATGASANDGGRITFADTANTTWDFTVAGLTVGGTIVLNDGVKFTSSIKIDGSISFPT